MLLHCKLKDDPDGKCDSTYSSCNIFKPYCEYNRKKHEEMLKITKFVATLLIT